ncbi:MAG: hypothetical protein FJ197_00960 [Gammaproteobacteria bacterium]|nr:hypothetical protein [Gammaproteobacteria bacterium]
MADVAAYDASLCERAQRYVVNAETLSPADGFAVRVQRGEGNGFHTIQMSIEPATRTVVIAASSPAVRAGESTLTTHVACKMVDRDRVNDTLDLELDGAVRSCGDVNALTYREALASLTPGERRRYQAAGRTLRFAPDYVAASGGEWLPLAIDDYIRADGPDLVVTAPSVRVAWNRDERNFFQGTQHCKLVTLAAMRRWMITGAERGDKELFPRAKVACAAPSSSTSRAGSCRFWFAPAQAMVCQDYSGSGWTIDSATEECGRRHASSDALRAAANRYEGSGGVFSDLTCSARDDAGEVGGTCVFQCQEGDEAQWRMPKVVAGSESPAGAAMMSRACDLYIP